MRISWLLALAIGLSGCSTSPAASPSDAGADDLSSAGELGAYVDSAVPPSIDMSRPPDLSLVGVDAGMCAVDGAVAAVDTLNDPDNCGGCGRRCCARLCMMGQCWCDGIGVTCCPVGTNGCLNMPFNLSTNSTNCGQCGHACYAGQTCSNGVCQ